MQFVKLDGEPLKDGFCKHFPHGYVKCENHGFCIECGFADRLRRTRPPNIPLFTWRDALKETKRSGGDVWINKPVLLTPDCMLRLGVERSTLYQMAFAYDGAGVFPMNAGSTLDVCLVADSARKYTVGRKDCYGVPTIDCARRYDELYLFEVSKMLNK